MIMNPMNFNSNTDTPGMPQNDVSPNKFRNFNTFPMSYEHLLTARYGDITPFYAFESWSDDKVPFASFHELRNYTMSSPLMNKVNMYKDYYLVPMRAILPRTWDYYIANPNQLDDIPDDAAPYITNVQNLLAQLRFLSNESVKNEFLNYYSDSLNEYYSIIIKYCIAFENVVSDGGLFSLLGCKLSKYFKFNQSQSINTFFQTFYDRLHDFVKNNDLALYLPSSGRFYYLSENAPSVYSDPNRVTWHRYLELMRTNSDFFIDFDDGLDDLSMFDDFIGISNLVDFDRNILGLPINISRIAAYQIACFHFHSNDKVDSIYSADLYRSMLETDYLSVNRIATFEMNGVTHLYDVFSNRYLSWAFGYVNNVAGDYVDYLYARLHYLYHLTTINKSLKFGDYFTGSRTRPLAVGDVNAPVVNNSVSAIDITRNIAMQRFLNAVNKTGRKISEYSQKILGGYVQPISTDPKFLAHDSVTIGAQEVENTADDTGAIKTNLRSEQSKYAFECEVSEPSIIIGVCSFEVKRYYSKTIDRHFFHKDRFDMFNPYFQNIGDQEIYSGEKGFGPWSIPFAYQLRHMEYKQRFSIASGGTVENLKSWSMIADNDFGSEMTDTNLSSDFIRSSNSDFDRFYSSLTGSSLCDYFHFIIKFDNQSTPLRNMEYSPTIL